MRAPAVSLVRKLTLAAVVGLLACSLMPLSSAFAEGEGEAGPAADSPQEVSAEQVDEGSGVAPMLASGLVGSPSSFVSADVALDGEPVIGSFTVDGLTFAVTEGSDVELVGVSPGWQQVTNSREGDGSTFAVPETVTYENIDYTLTSIASYAFYLSGVSDVTLPASVSDVDDRAFRSSDVASVTVAEGNPTYSSFDGALYDAEHLSLLLIPEGKQGAVLLPKTAESAAPSVFSHCPLVTQVSVEEGSAAFASENGLLYDASLTTLLRVPAGATDITIRDGCTTIAAGAMEACASLATIAAPASVISISPYLFEQEPETIMAPVAVYAITADDSIVEAKHDQLSSTISLNLSSQTLPRVEPSAIAVSVADSDAGSLWESRGVAVRDISEAQEAPSLSAESLGQAASYDAASNFTLYIHAPTDIWRQSVSVTGGDGGPAQKLPTPYKPSLIPNTSNPGIENRGVYWNEACTTLYVYGEGAEGNDPGKALFYKIGTSPDLMGVTSPPLFTGITSQGERDCYVAKQGGDGWNSGQLSKYKRVDVYLNWPNKKFTYELNGGSFDNSSANHPETVNYSTFCSNSDMVLSTPKNPGHTFEGWEVSSNDDTVYLDTVDLSTADSTGSVVNDGRRHKSLTLNKTCALVNLTFDAGWRAKSCTVTFNLNGGSGIKPANKVATYGEVMPNLGVSSNPEKTNYTFGGWYDTPNSSGGTKYYNADGTSVHEWDKDTTSTTTLYARWRCMVTFDRGPANNGTASRLVDQGSTVGNITCPTLSDWSFEGYTDDFGQSSWLYVNRSGEQATRTVDTDTTLYANWVREVTLDVNAEDAAAGNLSKLNACIGRPLGQVCIQVSSSNQDYPIRSLFTQGPSNVENWKPTRTGYTFQGYYDTDADTGGTCYISADGTSKLVTSSIPTTLYARWVPKSCTVTFDLNGSTDTLNKPTDGTAIYGKAMPTLSTTANPTRSGFLFKGWYDEPTGGTKYYDTNRTSARNWDKDTTSTQTLYAQWFMGSATFHANADGETGGGLYFHTYYDGQSHPIESLQGGSSHQVTWAGSTCVFDSGSGQVGGSFAVHYYPATNSPLYWFAARRTGYVQTAWEGTSPDGKQTILIDTKNRGPIKDGWTYTAKWVAKSYDVSFNACGGTIQGAASWSPSPKIACESDAWKSVSVPQRTGHAFLGWFTAPEGGTQVYDANGNAMANTAYWDSASRWCYDTDEKVTLYAQWFMGSATFHANADGETGGGLYFYTYYDKGLHPIEGLQDVSSHAVTWPDSNRTTIFGSKPEGAGGPFAVHYFPNADSPLCLFVAKRTGYVQTAWEGVSPDGEQVTIDKERGLIRDGWTYTAKWTPVLSADVPIAVTAEVDLLGIEDQVPASGYIESRCGAPLAVKQVSFTALAGAAELFGEANTASVSLQALALEGDASWDASAPTFSFPLSASAAEADPSKLAAFRMGAYEERIPISYRFAMPEDVLAAIDPARFEGTTTPVCSVAYTVALAQPTSDFQES